MSSISLKTSSLLSHLGHQALLRATCVWAKEQAKSFHTILNIPKPHFPPTSRWAEEEGGTCALLQCVFRCCQQRRVRPQKWAKIHSTARFFSLEVTDTFSLTPCARTPCCPPLWIVAGAWPHCVGFPENQICPPKKSDCSSRREISFPNLTNPLAWSAGHCFVGWCEAYWLRLGFPDRRLRGTKENPGPDWREAGLPTIRGLKICSNWS